MTHLHSLHTGWRRLIGCHKLQVIFRKRATNCRALLRKMAYKDKAFYGSLPPCSTRIANCYELDNPVIQQSKSDWSSFTSQSNIDFARTHTHTLTYTHTHTHTCVGVRASDEMSWMSHTRVLCVPWMYTWMYVSIHLSTYLTIRPERLLVQGGVESYGALSF